jgi:NAD-specific glutamate dehydrogenase
MGLNTRQAFEHLISDDEYRLSLPLSEQRSLASYKSMYKSGKLNLSNIEKFLEKHGYHVIQERLWDKKSAKAKGGKK